MQQGEKAPNFNLQNTEGKNVSLEEQIDHSKVLLVFFPLAFSSVCTDELCTIRDNMKMYNALSTNVLAISVDSFFTLKEFKKRNNLNFTLLSDFNKEVSKMYDVLYEDYFGMKGVSKRSVFVVNQNGIIEYAEVLENSDYLPDFKQLQKIIPQK